MADATLEFDASIQSIAALNAAAYRLIGQLTCHIEQNGGKYQCRLSSAKLDADALTTRFSDVVVDENVREQLSQRTEPVRNLILSLAFGSLAQKQD